MTKVNKIAISGWPGGGTSTLCLLLARNLNLKLVTGGETFRYLGKILNFENTGLDRVRVDQMLEKDFGVIYDKFIDLIIIDDNFSNLLIESDIAAFRLGKVPSLFSIFLQTEEHVRYSRLATDGRDKDQDLLKHRDQENQKFYKELHGIDWFDKVEIANKYNLQIDNSYMTIAEELKVVYRELRKLDYITEQDMEKLISSAEQDDKQYWEKGKQWYLDSLKSDKLVMPPEEILKLISERFSSEVEALPIQLKKIIYK